MSEIDARSTAPHQGSLDGRIYWDKAEGSLKVDTKVIAITPSSESGEEPDIQSVMDSLAREGGGVITLRNGTYTLTSDLVLSSNITLQGEAFGGVQLVFAGPYSIKADGTSIYNTGTISVSFGSPIVTGSGTTWSGNLTTGHTVIIAGLPYGIASVDSDTQITLEGVYNGQDQSGISYKSAVFKENIVLSNLVVISQASGVALNYALLPQLSGLIIPEPSLYGVAMENCAQLDLSQIVITNAGISGVSITDTDLITLRNVLSADSVSHGFILDNCTGVLFTSSPSVANGGDGFNVTDGNDIGWLFCQANANASNGISLAGATAQIVINSTDCSGNQGDGIKLAGTVSVATIISSIAAGNAAYGVNISGAGVYGTLVSSSQLLGNATAPIQDLGTATVLSSNQPYSAGTYLGNVVEDVTPQLGGDLDAQDNDITNVNQLFIDYLGGNTDANVNLDINATMLGTMTLAGAPTVDLHASTKKYVDDSVAAAGGYTDELAQDAVGTILADTATINMTYTDATPEIKGDVILDTDGTLAANSDTKIASQKAVKTYADTKQTLDSDLTTIAGLTATTDNFMQSKSSAWASRTPAQAAVDLLPYIYPVGCIYFSTNSTNPATSLGFGTWTAFGTGRVPVGFDEGAAEFNVDEETGGAKTHTLTIAELAFHSHGVGLVTIQDTGSGTVVHTEAGSTGTTDGEGGGGAHNNLQPYITVRMWKRTA